MPKTALEKLSVATAVGMTLSLLTTGVANAYTFTKIADTNDPFKEIFNFSSPINDQGTVAFRAIVNTAAVVGVFTGSGGAITTIADRTSGSFLSFGTPAINNEGTVAFYASLGTGESGIFTASGGTITTIADTSGLFSTIGNTWPSNPTINDQGTVVFRAPLDTGSCGVVTSSNGVVTTIADTSGLFSFVGPYGINDKGTVALFAQLDAGGEGFFIRSDAVTNKVITIGDALFGSTVTSLYGITNGLNDSGQLSFYAALADGTEGIFRADLEPQPVPEPASVLGLLTASALGVGTWRKGQQGRTL